MARFSLSLLAVFVIFAALALSLPTKTDDLTPNEQMGLDNTLDSLEAVTKIVTGLNNKDTNNKKNDIETAPSSSSQDSGDDDNDDDQDNGTEDKKVKAAQGTKTQKKPTSGNFVTATATATHTAKPTSVPNALGKLPLVGGLLGGTGAGL